MFGLFGSNTPSYQQTPGLTSQRRGGILGFLGGLFGGGGTPSYSGGDQPHARSAGLSLFVSAPSYVAPKADTVSSPDTSGSPETPDGGDEDEGSAAEGTTVKTITIIVKPGPGTTVEEVVQYFNDHPSTPRA